MADLVEEKQRLEDEVSQMHKNFDDLSEKCDSYVSIIEKQKKLGATFNQAFNPEKQMSMLEREIEKLQLQNKAYVSRAFVLIFFH